MGQRLKAQGSAASQEIKIPNTRGRGPCDPLATSGPSIIGEGQAAGPPQWAARARVTSPPSPA